MLQVLMQASARPDLFTKSTAVFWDDPHISQQMLQVHLDPEWGAASYPLSTIDAIVDWLVSYLRLQPGQAVLDIGCGPGLYCTRLAKRGLEVTGMDFSRNSLRYARGQAEKENLGITYVYQDYLTLDTEMTHDLVTLIYCDFGVLPPDTQHALLQRIWRTLRPGGHFVCDVFTPAHRQPPHEKREWSFHESGFWRPRPHLVLSQIFAYPQVATFCDQYIVWDEVNDLKIYRMWEQVYTETRLQSLLRAAGFTHLECFADLMGQPFTAESPSLAIVAQKPTLE